MAFEIRPITVEPGDTLCTPSPRSIWATARSGRKFSSPTRRRSPTRRQVQELPERIGPNFIWPGTVLQIVITDFDDDEEPEPSAL